MQALQFFEMPGTISPATHCHIPKTPIMSNTVRTTDFVRRFKIVRQEIVCHRCVYGDEMGVSLLGRKCSKGTTVSDKIVPPFSV
jgi:hypothetical protein